MQRKVYLAIRQFYTFIVIISLISNQVTCKEKCSWDKYYSIATENCQSCKAECEPGRRYAGDTCETECQKYLQRIAATTKFTPSVIISAPTINGSIPPVPIDHPGKRTKSASIGTPTVIGISVGACLLGVLLVITVVVFVIKNRRKMNSRQHSKEDIEMEEVNSAGVTPHPTQITHLEANTDDNLSIRSCGHDIVTEAESNEYSRMLPSHTAPPPELSNSADHLVTNAEATSLKTTYE